MSAPRMLLSAGMIQGGRSGVGRYVIELAAHLPAYLGEMELHVCGLAEDRRFFPKIDDDHWIDIPASASGGLKNWLWHQQYIPRICVLGKFYLLHVPSYRRIVYRCPIPQVVTIHDCAPFVLRDKYGPLRGFFGRQVAPRLARACDAVITVSNYTAGDIQKYFTIAPEKVFPIHCGLDPDVFHSQRQETCQAFLKEQQQELPFFLYISRLEHPGKNHVRLIQAFEDFRAAHATPCQLLLGGADWQGAEVIHQRVAESPNREDIRFLGFIDDQDLPLWYASAQALIHPSLFEGFGLPIVEALASETLVATADRGSLPEVGGECVHYFDPENVGAIAEAFAAMTALSTSEATRIKSAGAQWAQNFSWDKTARATHALYLRTLSK